MVQFICEAHTNIEEREEETKMTKIEWKQVDTTWSPYVRMYCKQKLNCIQFQYFSSSCIDEPEHNTHQELTNKEEQIIIVWFK